MMVLTEKYLPVEAPVGSKKKCTSQHSHLSEVFSEIVAYLFQIRNMVKDLRGAAVPFSNFLEDPNLQM